MILTDLYRRHRQGGNILHSAVDRGQGNLVHRRSPTPHPEHSAQRAYRPNWAVRVELTFHLILKIYPCPEMLQCGNELFIS